jgi:hypothetical protein
MDLRPLKKNVVPEPPKSFAKMIGPSLILVGLGLGTGELILWPYLTANWGLGIIWGAALGITIQFFLNTEIERYTLANGESIFVGFARIFKWIPSWFVASTIIAWIWPAFAAASVGALAPFGIVNTPGGMPLATIAMIIELLLVGAILTLGPVLYKTVETFQKVLISIGIPLIIFVAINVVTWDAIEALFKGLVGIGEGYHFFPSDSGFPFMAFLAAFAYAGAGGNLLLAQSFYVKEKGYAMGKYSGRITSLITGKSENVDIQGTTFEPKKEEVDKFTKWWNMANAEHLLVFWGLGLFTMLLLALISYSTTYGHAGNAEGINFLYAQSKIISATTSPMVANALLIVTCLMLFATQLTVIDGAGRIITENIVLLSKGQATSKKVQLTFYSSIWALILFGIMVLLAGVTQPQSLIVIGAVINAVCMTVFAGILIKTNRRLLPTPAQPVLWRRIVVGICFTILVIFTTLVLLDSFTSIDVFALLRGLF